MAVLSSVPSVKSFMSLLLLLLSGRFDIEQLLQQRVSEVHPCDLNVYLCGIVLEYCRDKAHEG